MDFLSKSLHIQVREETNSQNLPLPNYIKSRYNIKKVWMDRQKVFVLEPKAELDKINILKKHILRIKEEENIPVVIVTERMTSRQKEAFIKAGISFVVTGKQIYLPFMGVLLSNRNDAETFEADRLIPSAQAILFYYIEKRTDDLYVKELVDNLGFSSMTISRGVKQLEELNLIKTYKNKVQKVITTEFNLFELLKKSEKFLINPIKEVGYISKDQINEYCYKAGDLALSEYSMLNPPKVPCYAVADDEKWRKMLKKYLIDEDNEVEIQIWKYNPAILTDTNLVDKLSLALSYCDDKDERISQEIDEILEEYR